jgi:hypothetical protein
MMSLADVRLQEGESLENALRRFKRKVQQEDIITGPVFTSGISSQARHRTVG